MYEFNFSVNLFVVIWGIVLSAISTYGLIYVPWVLRDDKKAQKWINVTLVMFFVNPFLKRLVISDFDFTFLLLTICFGSCFFVIVALLWTIGKKLKKPDWDFEGIESEKNNSESRRKGWPKAENYFLTFFLWFTYTVVMLPVFVFTDYNKVVSYSRDDKKVFTAKFGVRLQFDEGYVYFKEKEANVYKNLTPKEVEEVKTILMKKAENLRGFSVSEKTEFRDVPSGFYNFVNRVAKRDGNLEIRTD